jgi:SAM-dependent methyltransferase
VTGIDLSPKAIEYCRSKYGDSCRWLCDDAFKPTRAGEFDYIFCFWFMYFNAFDVAREGAAAGHSLIKLLKPGGSLFFLCAYRCSVAGA